MLFKVKFFEEESDHFKIVSSSADGCVFLSTLLSSGSELVDKPLFDHSLAVHKVAITSNKMILSASEDGIVAEFDVRCGSSSELITLKENGFRVPLFSVAAHPQKDFFCIAGRDHLVRVYDRRACKTIHSQFCPKHLMV